MPRKTPTPPSQWKAEYQGQKKRGEDKGQLERQKARGAYDKAGIDRSAKDIDHAVKIKDGGKSTPGNMRLRNRAANRGDNGHKKGEK